VTSATGEPRVVAFDDGALVLSVSVGADGIARLERLGPGTAAVARDEAGPGGTTAGPVSDVAGPAASGAWPGSSGVTGPGPAGLARALPLVDVLTPGTGRSWSGARHAESALATRLRYRSHSEQAEEPWWLLRFELGDPGTGLRAEVCYRILAGEGVLQAWTELTNEGSEPVMIEAVTSFLAGGLPAGAGIEDLDLLWAESDWLAEGRWQRRWLRDALPDTDRRAHPASPRGCLGFTSSGSWSSAAYLPMAALASRRDGACWAWQIEHNGAWHWEVGERGTGAYLAVLGPADAEHQWRQTLAPGASFTTVPIAIAVSGDGFEGAVARLTRYRRAIRRPHPDHRDLPVIFNDYMNTLMANPSTERLLPLISAAARVGAEYFCIDAGWYDDGAGWWDSAGDWTPAASRFPGGITEVLDHIRVAGMVPGLWLEPEVAAVGSAAARELPAGAFFHRNGIRLVEHGRHHLDLRHPAAVKHLDEAADFLVGDLGIGYLKLDYNIRADPGTDSGGVSAGAGLLGHNRALLDWLDRLLDRYPGLTIENCASGAMRADYAMLSRLQLQSTSDQQDFLRYPVITAAAMAAMAPEQAGIWSYPQPGFSQDEIAFTLCSALLGRMHLSGHIDHMSAEQQDLVAQAVSLYKEIRPDFTGSVPFWPLGLPRWADSWVALGLRGTRRSYLLVWRRGHLQPAGAGTRPAAAATPVAPVAAMTAPAAATGPGGGSAGDPAETPMPVRHLAGRAVTADVLFPGQAGAQARWNAMTGELTVRLPATRSACLLRLQET
jgi:alpha-galactosidase